MKTGMMTKTGTPEEIPKTKAQLEKEKMRTLLKKAKRRLIKQHEREQDVKKKKRAEQVKFKRQKASGENWDDSSENLDNMDWTDEDSDLELGGSAHKGQSLNKWNPSNMQVAVYAVLEDRKLPMRKRIGIRKISAQCGVPRNTLNQRVLGRVKGFGHKSGGEKIPKLFTPEEEKELATCILQHADAGFPFTPKAMRDLAYEFAFLKGLRKFNVDGEMSRSWQRCFLRRHPEIQLKGP